MRTCNLPTQPCMEGNPTVTKSLVRAPIGPIGAFLLFLGSYTERKGGNNGRALPSPAVRTFSHIPIPGLLCPPIRCRPLTFGFG